MILAILLKMILLSFLCFLLFKIPVLLYLNSLNLFWETDEKLIAVSFIMLLKNQMLAIKLNIFNVLKCFVVRLRY